MRIIAARAALWLLSGLCLMSGCNSKKINSKSVAVLATTRVSLGSDGTQGTNDAVNDRPAISANGRFVAFTSKASNIVGNDTNPFADVFLRDNVARKTVLVSVDKNNQFSGTGGASGRPAISGDGRYVVFVSKATNLTNEATGGFQQIFMRDMVLGVTQVVSRTSGPPFGGLIVVGDGDSDNPVMSQDGTVVAFETSAINLDGVPLGGDDTSADRDIYRRKVVDTSGAYPTELVSIISGSAPGTFGKGTGSSTKPSISADGRYIAFESTAPNLVTLSDDGGLDLNANVDVFVRDIQTNRTVRCSVPKTGITQPDAGDGASQSATISGDGQIVVFRSTAFNLHPDDDGSTSDIFLRSWNLGLASFTEILSVHTSGAQAGSSCDNPSISADGNLVTWVSSSSNLVNGDSNAQADVFLRNRATRQTARVSVSTFGNELNALSGIPRISANGQYVVFYTEATNAADDDINGASDIFLRGPPF